MEKKYQVNRSRTYMRTITSIWVAAFLLAQESQADGWKNYTCQPVEKSYGDGDSFRGKADTGYTYIWRLYGADCPETDMTFPTRVKEQAKYFRVDESTVLRFGKEASNFTGKFLANEFLVYTRKQDAGGQSEKNRYFAHVTANGESLAAALVERGLARAYGQFESFVENGQRDEKSLKRHLENLEVKARRAKVGIWAESR